MSYDPMNDVLLTLAIAMSTGSSSEGLEAVEKLEQNRARRDCMLPRKMFPNKETFEALGFKFEDVHDDVLYQAALPEGWTIEHDGGYWTDLFDEKGRRRGNYFYKGAFYDRDGHMSLNRRFRIDYDHIDPDDYDTPVKVFVKDYDDRIVFEAGQCEKAYGAEYDNLIYQAKNYLNTNYPGWEDETKYWD